MHNGSGSWTKVPLVLLFLYKYFQIQNVIWCEPQEDQQEDSTASFKRSRHGSLSNSPDSSPTSLTSVIPKYTIDEENWLQGKKDYTGKSDYKVICATRWPINFKQR